LIGALKYMEIFEYSFELQPEVIVAVPPQHVSIESKLKGVRLNETALL